MPEHVTPQASAQAQHRTPQGHDETIAVSTEGLTAQCGICFPCYTLSDPAHLHIPPTAPDAACNEEASTSSRVKSD